MIRKIPVVLLSGLDIIISAAAFYGAYYLRQQTDIFDVDAYLLNYGEYNRFFLFVVILSFLCFYFMECYEHFNYKNYFHVSKTNFIILFIIMAFSFIYKQYSYSRLVFFFFFCFANIGMWIIRAVFIQIEQKMYQNGRFLRNATVIGSSKASHDFLCENNGYRFIQFNSSDEQHVIDELQQFICDEKIAEVFVDMKGFSFLDILPVRLMCEREKCVVNVYPSVENIISINSRIASLNGVLFLQLTSVRSKKIYYVAKRMFDIIFSLTVLVLTLPLIVCCMFMLVILYRVNPLFTQKRTGLDGKEFIIYKLRTLKENSSDYDITPRIQNDDRVLPFGRFLRRFCIDELPQFINVIKGDMSVVGPRPEMPFITEKYTEIEQRRLEVLPGITGLWQLYGRDDGTSIHENIKYDLYYIEKQSLVFDIEIILKTVFYVIFTA